MGLEFSVLVVLSISVLSLGLVPVYGQEIVVLNSTVPCFLNETASYNMWKNCAADEDFLEFSVQGFMWVTGGYFSMILVSILIGFTYVKYHKAVYPLLIGLFFMPISLTLFPELFVTWALLMAGAVIFILVWYTFIKQTKEY